MRPDYVPPAWTRGPINRRFWRSPRRVFVWLLAAPLVTGGVALGVLLAGQTALGVLLAVAAAVSLAQGVIYAPRAWRASRQNHEDS
jgi:hypothetical protein